MVLLLVGVSFIANALGAADALTSTELFHRLLPQHQTGLDDPFGRIERVLVRVTAVRSEASLVAAPAFLWLSMRLFAAVRIALDTIFEAAAVPRKAAAQILGFLRAKLRDAIMVVFTVALFMMNTVLTAVVHLAERLGTERVPALEFLVSGAGRVAVQVLAIVFSVLPFWFIYRFASTKPLRSRPALIAAGVTAMGYEVSKWLYGLYLGDARTLEAVSRGDADLLAALLFVFWVYVTALVFLVGGVLAHTLQTSAAPAARRR